MATPRSRPAPFLAALRLARRDMRHHRLSSALIALLLALLVGGAVAADALVRSSVPAPETHARMMLGETAQARVEWEMPGRVLQSPESDTAVSEGEQSASPPRGGYEDLLLSLLPEEASLVGAEQGTVQVETGGRSTEGLTALEADTAAPDLAGMFDLRDGAYPGAPGEVMVGLGLARRLDVRVGDALTLTDAEGTAREATVAGVYRATRNPADLVLAPGSLLHTGDRLESPVSSALWFVTGGGPVPWETVLEVNETGASVLSRAVLADPPEASEVPLLEAASVPGPAHTIWLFASVLAGVSLLVGLVVGPAVAVRTRRATRELALVSAQGGDSRTLRRVVLAGAFLVSSVGGLAGALAGALGVWAFTAFLRSRGDVTFPELVLPLWDVALFWLLGVSVALVSALPPAMRAGRVDPVSVLSGHPSPPTGRRGPWWAALCLLVGGSLAATGHVAALPSLYVPGAIVGSVSLILLVPVLVAALAHPARWLPLTPRLALREAGRNRERTAMSVTVITATVAALVAVAVTTTSAVTSESSAHQARAAEGTALLYFDAPEDLVPEQVDAAAEALRAELGSDTVARVRMATPERVLRALPDPDRPCPDWAVMPPPGFRSGPAPDDLFQDDLDCAPDKHNQDRNHQLTWQSDGWNNALVDDGSLVRALGLPGADEAARALENGRAVVTRDADLWSDGRARVEAFTPGEGSEPDADSGVFGQVRVADGGSVTGDGVSGRSPDLAVPDEGGSARAEADLVLDSVSVDWPSAQYGLIVPPSLLAEWGQGEQVVGLVATTAHAPSPGAVDSARSAVREAAGAQLFVEAPYSSPRTQRMYALLALAAVVGIGACLVATRLATEDARSERETLAAVGASPLTDRSLAGARSGTVAVLGTTAGLVAGLAVGVTGVLAENFAPGFHDPVWPLVVPWPLLAVCLGGLVTAAVVLGAVTASGPGRSGVRARDPAA